MRTAPFLASLAVLLAVPGPAAGWVRSTVPGTDVCLFLPSRTQPWGAASPLGLSDGDAISEEEALAAIRRSFRVWEAEECVDLTFPEGSRVPPTIGANSKGKNVITVVFRNASCDHVVPDDDPCWEDGGCANAYGCWDGDPLQIGLTTTTFSRCTGEILDSDIELNAADYRFTVEDGPPCSGGSQDGCVETDLENTLVHEIGHVIGLGHSADREATMYARSAEGETSKRDLAADDREALCAIYPAGGPTSVCEPVENCPSGSGKSRAGSGGGCGTAGAAGLAGLGAVLPLLWRRRRAGRGGGA
jgi:hypothetical protein